jgi:hypothetical protein
MLTKLSLLVMVFVGVVLCGCEDDKDSSANGTASIRGEMTYVSPEFSPGIVSGIKVDLVGPVTMHATSDGKGVFQFANVPGGQYTLVFHVNGGEASYALNVPEGKAVVLVHVRVNKNGSVTVYSDAPDAVNIAGSWKFYLKAPGTSNQKLVVVQDGEAVSGTLGDYYRFTGSVSGNSVSLDFSYISGGVALKSATGTINEAADGMSGTWSDGAGGGGAWSASKDGLNY